MKKQSKNSKYAFISITIMSVMLALSACNNNKKAEENTASTDSKVEVPKMDLLAATVIGDLETIKQHIEAGSDMDITDPNMGSTALMTAAVFNRIEIAEALIEAGADINKLNNDGASALHSAAFLCRPEIVKMLVEHGIDKDIKNNFGSTALESVEAPFEFVKPIYDKFSKDLGPLGFKLDYDQVQKLRPQIAEMLK